MNADGEHVPWEVCEGHFLPSDRLYYPIEQSGQQKAVSNLTCSAGSGGTSINPS